MLFCTGHTLSRDCYSELGMGWIIQKEQMQCIGEITRKVFLLGNFPASEFYMPTFRNTLFHLHRQVGVIKFRRRGITQKKAYFSCNFPNKLHLFFFLNYPAHPYLTVTVPWQCVACTNWQRSSICNYRIPNRYRSPMLQCILRIR
jgi:hypothetical protein